MCIYVFGSLHTCGSSCVWKCLCIQVFIPTVCMCAYVHVCVCVCVCAYAPVDLLIFMEGARINSSSDWESACSMSSYPHLGSFCLRSAWSSLSPEGGFCSPFSWSQSKMKLKRKSRERIYKLELFIFSERAVICSEIHGMSSAVGKFSHLLKKLRPSWRGPESSDVPAPQAPQPIPWAARTLPLWLTRTNHLARNQEPGRALGSHFPKPLKC